MVSDPDRLFDVGDFGRAPEEVAVAQPEGLTVRVIADVASINREFDYVIAESMVTKSPVPIQIGTMVRVPLHGRNVAAWVVGCDVEPPPGVRLRAVTKISGIGPPAEVVDLCRWASWRWAAKLPSMLGAASPPTMVRAVPTPAGHGPGAALPAAASTGHSVTVSRRAPANDIVPLITATAAEVTGALLVVTPTFAAARSIAQRCRAAGVNLAMYPDGWARAAAGASVIGTRSAVFAPIADLGAIMVIDEHDEGLQNEGSPTWHARDLAVERARRAGVPVILVSPTPTLEALEAATEVAASSRAEERSGWARVEVIDRREEDIGRSGLYSEGLVAAMRAAGGRVVCVLNRTGRAQMLGCVRCGTVATCERCEAAVRQDEEHRLVCRQCGAERPQICQSCSSTAFRQIRIGVTKAREQLEALLREPVDEVTGASRKSAAAGTTRGSSARVIVGTEAVLQRVSTATLVAFLEFDQELGAPRYRAAEEALTLLARASTIVRGRSGLVLVQTRQPGHEVIVAALSADPTKVSDVEHRRRKMLALPPFVTLAVVGGEAAPEYMEMLTRELASSTDVTVDQRSDDQWLVRSKDRALLLDAIAAIGRPSGRLRLQIDPARLPQ